MYLDIDPFLDQFPQIKLSLEFYGVCSFKQFSIPFDFIVDEYFSLLDSSRVCSFKQLSNLFDFIRREIFSIASSSLREFPRSNSFRFFSILSTKSIFYCFFVSPGVCSFQQFSILSSKDIFHCFPRACSFKHFSEYSIFNFQEYVLLPFPECLQSSCRRMFSVASPIFFAGLARSNSLEF